LPPSPVVLRADTSDASCTVGRMEKAMIRSVQQRPPVEPRQWGKLERGPPESLAS
jgi:hypothetical protein